MKKMVIAAVLLLLGGAWYSAVSNYIEKPQEYQKLLKNAQEMEAKGIYYDAILDYQEALKYNLKNVNLYYKIAEAYEQLGEDENYEQMMLEAINLEKDNEEAVLTLTDHYLALDKKEDAIALLKGQIKKNGSESLNAKLQTLAGGYTRYSQEYEYISNPCIGYMKVQMNSQMGLVDATGKTVIWPQYNDIGVFGSNNFAPVKTENETYFIDENNYKRRVADVDCQELGIANEGVIPACQNGKWGYLNFDLQPVTEFVYDAATPVFSSMAAVCKDGKWALVDAKLNQITEFEFDDVIRDDWGFCSRNGVVFAKSSDAYRLINSEGLQIGKDTFENARAFVSDQPAAVQKDGKWGFVSISGELVQECRYQDADSFSEIGYAPVEENDLWGYIKGNGDYLITPVFDGAKCFTGKGLAPVMNNGTWSFIQLDIF